MTNEAKPTGKQETADLRNIAVRIRKNYWKKLIQKSTSEIQTNRLAGTKIKNRNRPAKYKQTD